MNVSVTSPSSPSSPVRLTKGAIARIAGVLAKEPPGTALRIGVDGGGCSGFQYTFDLVEKIADDDLVIRQAGAVVCIDPLSLSFMGGAVIDFEDSVIGQAFKIDNPNAVAACGCGTSFTV